MTDQPVAPGGGQDHRERLGHTLRELRRTRALTLRQLAGLMGVSPATLSSIENGRTGVSSERVSVMAEILEVPVERVFAGSTTHGPDPRSPLGPGPPTGRPVPDLDDWRSFPPLVLDVALAGALSAFLEFGYHGATMRIIAERANLSVPGLYHYYASKQEMLVALLDLTMSDLGARTQAAMAEGTDAVERFALIVECLALYHTHRRELAFVGASEMRSLAPEARARVAAVRRDEQRLVDVEVEEAARSGAFATTQPHEAARAVVTMCTALAQWYRGHGPTTAEHIAEQYVDFALDLVRCQAPRPGTSTGR